MLRKLALGTLVAGVALIGAVVPAAASTAPGHSASVVVSAAKPHAISSLCGFTGSQPLLQRGSQGTAVKQAQCELNWAFAFGSSNNYGNGPFGGLTVDGDFGTNTFNATEDFQRCAGDRVDGQIGPQTWNSLNFWVNQPGFCRG